MKRQGDILFVKTSKKRPDWLDDLCRKPVDGRLIVAVGEKTGHNHVIEVPAAVEAWGADTENAPVSWLDVALETTVEHPEHGPVVLEPGKWKVLAQREYQDRPRYSYD